MPRVSAVRSLSRRPTALAHNRTACVTDLRITLAKTLRMISCFRLASRTSSFIVMKIDAASLNRIRSTALRAIS